MAKVLHFPASDEEALQTSGPAASGDEEARAAALDPRSSFVVEAPAGSGKTGLLVQRFLKLLGNSEVAQPEEVLAMTFTRKATAEMQQRVLEQLQAAHAQLEAAHAQLQGDARPAPPLDDTDAFNRENRALALAVLERDARLGWNLLTQPQRLNIRSLDSICLEIANSLPLLSGSGGWREPVEDARPLYRLAARRTLLQLGDVESPALHHALRTLLLHRDGSLSDCENLIAGMLATRDQWGELVPLGAAPLDDATLDRQVRPRLERALESIVCAGLSHALRVLPRPLLHELTQFAAEHAHLPGHHDLDSPIALCAGRHDPPDTEAAHLEHWAALIGLLVKPSDGGWRKSFAHNHLGFKPPRAELDRLKRLAAEAQSGPFGDTLREALCAVLALPPARYPDEQWAVARALFHILRRALVELKLLFAERGQCDYIELGLAARAALSAPADGSGDTPDDTPDIALAAGSRLRHLLVDEMQDTSSAQYDLIRLLTSSWDGHSQTVFLVGDPKQSIYLFRQANVERFLRTLQDRRLGGIALTPLRLTANFRSQAALVGAFNDTFGGPHPGGRIFPPPVSLAPPDGPASGSVISGQRSPAFAEVEVPFVAATATRAATLPDAVVWHTTVLGEESGDESVHESFGPALQLTAAAADHNTQEAIAVRRLIEQRLALPLPEGRNDPRAPRPWRIAVLARARTHLAAIVQELKAHDGKPAIPFRGVDLDPLDELPEVLDALALTRALLHPADRIAWLAVLRAPWCGLQLADLLRLTGEGDLHPTPGPHERPESTAYATVGTLVRSRRQHLSGEGQRLLDRAWPVLEAAVASLGRTPLAVHVERTWRSLGGDAPLSAQQRDNVLRFLRVLRELETDPGVSSLDMLDVLTARLRQLFAEPAAGSAVQVELMTIHKAKGLEWDVVLLPGLHRAPRSNGAVLLNWLELDGPATDAPAQLSAQPSDGLSAGDDAASILLAPIRGKGSHSGQRSDSARLNDWLKDVRGRRERAEEKRLFYVAATRAREQLHVFAALARKKNDSALALPANGTLLKACWPAAEPHFAQLTAVSQTLTAVPQTLTAVPQTLTAVPQTHASAPQTPGGPFIAQLDRAMSGLGDNSPDGLAHAPAFEPGLDLAASANGHTPGLAPAAPPVLQRLPLSFDPAARFTAAAAHRVAYVPASALHSAPAFDRPEGGFAARAFGNVVHRYLQGLAARLSDPSTTPEALLSELPSWESRLNASLRGEGLAPAVAAREAGRALRALTLTLHDPIGRWILAPHAGAASERSLTLATHGAQGAERSLRIDRTFLAGPTPPSPDPASAAASPDRCIWIVDFKTTDPGARSPDLFAAAEIARYAAQLEAYAALRRSLPDGQLPVRLGLFYPLIPRLLHWPSSPQPSVTF